MSLSMDELAALGMLLEEHRARLLAAVRRRIDPALAARLDPEEVLSEAFFVARRKYPAFKTRPSMSAYAWLYRIVLDCLIEAWRRETRECRDVGRELPWPAASSIQLGLRLLDTGTSPSDAVERRDLQERMRLTLELLKPRDRDVLMMRHFDELSHREVAEVLGISESAATLRYVRALQRLKEAWKTLYGDRG